MFNLILLSIVILTGICFCLRFAWSHGIQVKTGTSYKQYQLFKSPCPAAIHWIAEFFYVALLVFVFRSFVVEPFHIPSASMNPTLTQGDFIAVKKFAYGLRNPITGQKLMEIGDPQRGDVIVFNNPGDPSLQFVKRVIGLPGDELAMKNNVLFINGVQVERVGDSEIIGGVSHLVGKSEQGKDFDVVVPAGHYFVMGDNRDNSSDSRVWGFVPDQMVLGKASVIWWNMDLSTATFNLGRIGRFD